MSSIDISSGRVDCAEARHLFRDVPLLELGQRAFHQKRERFGDAITYVVNKHVNPTNQCVYTCKFCDFAAASSDEHAYSLTEDAIIDELSDPMLSEAHIVGGLWPQWGFKRSVALVRQIRAVRSDLWIKAFTAVEIAYFARMERTSVTSVLHALKEAGVNALPGGGAEVLSDRVHAALYPDKIGPSEWLAIHEEAHRIGLPSNCTLLFGHIETDDEIIEHFMQLRALQDKTGGFQSFIPLAYQPGRSGLVQRMVSAPRCLRVVALARLLLDNIPHIKAYWPSLHIETAVTALNFGADDLDGTLGAERIMQLADTEAPARLSARQMQTMIRQAGQTPVRRDGRFREQEGAQPAYAESCR